MDELNHRRTGNFLPGGGGKLFTQKNLASCPNFCERVRKKLGAHYLFIYLCILQHRPYSAYESGLIQLVFRVNTKFEHKLRRHKQAFGKIATTVVLR